MKKVLYIVSLCFFALIPLFSAASEAGTSFNSAAYSLRNGFYSRSLRQGLEVIDTTASNFCAQLLNHAPVFQAYQLTGTNSFYSITADNGTVDLSLTVSYHYSNDKVEFNLILDTSLSAVERIFNLIRSFEFLADKGPYQKETIRLFKTDYHYLTENDNSYSLLYLKEKDGYVDTGVLMRIEAQSVGRWKTQDRKRFFTDINTEFYKQVKLSLPEKWFR